MLNDSVIHGLLPNSGGYSLGKAGHQLPWHLYNSATGALGFRIDLNVLPIWQDYDGSGVRVAIYDDGARVVNASLARAFAGVFSPGAVDQAGPHATAVAGIVGADGTGGAFGIAAGVTATMTQVLGTTFAVIERAMLNQAAFDVVNHSWGWSRDLYVDKSSALFATFFRGIDHAAANGRDGLGTIMVAAAGNDGVRGGDVNMSHFPSDRQVIAVAAVTDQGQVASFSNGGAALLVSGLSSGGLRGITTTDLAGSAGYSPGDVTDRFGGTSAAAPTVTGIVALMLEANPLLGWRDVQSILAMTARPVAGTTFVENGAGNWNGGGMRFSHDAGFGLVDARAAVRLAETWTVRSTSTNEAVVRADVAQTASLTTGQTLQYFFTLATSVVVETVEVLLQGRHTRIGDLLIELVSPSGTTSQLLDSPKLTASFAGWTFSASAFRGEDAGGTWALRVTDRLPGHDGTFFGATLKAYGSAASVDDEYVFTDQYAHLSRDPARQLLDDGVGVNTINAAAVSTAVSIDLAPGAVSKIAGNPLRLSENSIVQRAIGGDGDDVIRGNNHANELFGGRGFNILEGRGGDDILLPGPDGGRVDGGAGFDTLVIQGARADFDLRESGSWIIITGRGGGPRYEATSVEHIRFEDASLVLPTNATHLAVMRLYETLLDRAADANGLAAWSGLVEAGALTLAGVASALKSSQEFATGPASLSTQDFVLRAYETALGRQPDASEVSSWMSLIARDGLCVSRVAAHFAEAELPASFEAAAIAEHGYWI